MPTPAPAIWSDRLAETLQRYDEALSVQGKVAARLVRPRNQWPVEELVSRGVDTINNPAVLDRRLAELEPAGRQVLALIGHSRQPCWALGNVVELMMALGHEDGLKPILDLLDAGLLFPLLPPLPSGADRRVGRLVSFEQWLSTAGAAGLRVFSPPQIATRAIGADLGLPDLSQEEAPIADPQSAIRNPQSAIPQESDGLEWLIRLGVLWQQVSTGPLRRTQQGRTLRIAATSNGWNRTRC